MNNEELLKKLEILYKVLNKIIIVPDSDWKTRIYANAALSYFINPNDVIPESKLNLEGYLDDFYVCLLILKDIKQYRTDLVKSIFSKYSNDDVNLFIINNLDYCENELGNKVEFIKKIIGYDSLSKLDLANKYLNNDKIIINNKYYEVIGVIAYLYDELSKKTKYNIELNHITETEYFFDIDRINKKYKSGSDFKSKIDNIEDLNLLFFDYETKLTKLNLNTKYGPLLQFALPLFKTLCNVQNNILQKDWITKHEINCALAYFGLIEDVISDDSKEGLGLIDDLFITSFVLIDIFERNPNMITSHLADGLTLSDIDFVFDNTSTILEDYVGEILNILGLNDLLHYYDLTNLKLPRKTLLNGNRIKSIFDTLFNLYLIDSKETKLNLEIENISSKYIDNPSKTWRDNRCRLIDLEMASKDDFNKRQAIGNRSRYYVSFEKIINELIKELNEEQRHKLNQFIDLSLKLSYNKNMENEIKHDEDVEFKSIILKHKLLCG